MSEDQKLEALGEILEYAFGDLETDRVMIFSTFRGTLHYLEEKLREKGYSLELVYGPTPARDEDCRRGEKSRERIGTEFRRGEFQILLASEVAGEGLDFEHCHVVINYDLPWNPMRVEQRIGRCDRIGQRSDKVHVGVSPALERLSREYSRAYTRGFIFLSAPWVNLRSYWARRSPRSREMFLQVVCPRGNKSSASRESARQSKTESSNENPSPSRASSPYKAGS